VHDRDATASQHVSTLRTLLGPIPFHAALKEILVARGVPIRPDVRPPLRPLAPEEREIAFDAARRVGAL